MLLASRSILNSYKKNAENLDTLIKPGFHMIVTVGDASPRQARGHIGDVWVKWEHFLNDVADQTATVRGRIKKVEMSFFFQMHYLLQGMAVILQIYIN